MTRKYAVLTLGVISVSFAAIFIRLAEAPPLVIAAYRLCLASLVVAPMAWIRSRQELRGLSRQDVLLAMLSGAFLALHFGLWIASLSYTSVASSVVLVTANPIFVAIASYLLFRERLGRQAILGIVVCLVGAILIGYGNWRLGPQPLLGGVLALLGALAVAGYLLIGRRLRQNIGILSYTALTYSSAAVLLLVAALAFGHPLFGYSPTTYLMLVLLAVVPQLIGHTSLNWSLRFVSATLVTIAVLGEPVLATALAFAMLDEVPTVTEAIGGVLILAGIFVAFRRGGTGWRDADLDSTMDRSV
ncbi:MAG TPA: DMT family transporter [Dehalococcoidales bacterium]|nr:DMT family transporter [Dehalococcoidales bacterium]